MNHAFTSASAESSIWRAIGDPLLPPLGDGALTGESIAVKDLFAVEGFAVGAGVPDYLASQPVEVQHAPALYRLMAAGASLRGIAQTDQFAYSLDGDNPHYGTPPNAAAPEALPGGSSSGPAAAVALGAATIGLGTDTAGSIRVPASYQGLWGLRTTHGLVPTDGVLPLAPAFDTIGLLAASPEVLGRAAHALIGDQARLPVTDRLFWSDLLPLLPNLADVYEAFRVSQAHQAWQMHGAWISAHPRALLGSVRARFAAAQNTDAATNARAEAALSVFRARLDDLLGDKLLVMPSAAGPPPSRLTPPGDLERRRRATVHLTCIASITGRPVVSAPLTTTPEGPVGTSYLGPPMSDHSILALAAADALGEIEAGQPKH